MSDTFEDAFEKVRKLARSENMKIRFVSLVCENDAAKLLGYSSGDTLRKQGEGRIIPSVRRGNRRFYSLSDIARVWHEKK